MCVCVCSFFICSPAMMMAIIGQLKNNNGSGDATTRVERRASRAQHNRVAVETPTQPKRHAWLRGINTHTHTITLVLAVHLSMIDVITHEDISARRARRARRVIAENDFPIKQLPSAISAMMGG